ncbi:ribonuclease H2 subunit C [Thrips palmi]|uniref:Ribonuclease H2 subunit C n=1 Tax=Thrips palmi TaxID=161013 RepID=A0A6P8Y2S8_THRPL|nr:ribonuclease H2 subunit C [Thrips palmi]XP_034230629.1 ribonuclease H2 subunit C [Thrips palmi]XP_034230630.1 ribonuclease H2 subunit C [Thrips palmi]
MAIQLNISAKIAETPAEDQPTVHYMPCRIKSDGPANVSSYFKPIPLESDPKYKKASFRGRPLLGKDIVMPSGYKGLVVQETKQPLVENIDRTLHVSHVFDKITYWNWDKMPSANDAFISALDWIDIAEAIHAPVDSSKD